MKQANPAAWREGNNRLYEYYKSAAKEFPDTIQEMAPLFAAVLHGCQAGKHQEAFYEVFWKRIERGQEYFNWRKLGAFGADLSALSSFFDPPWRKPVAVLPENAKSGLVAMAGLDLRALGRLAEAAQPMQASLDAYIAQNQLAFAALIAGSLSELYLTIGDVTQALAYAEHSIQLADRSSDAFQRMSKRTTFGDAQHQAGRLAEAEATFREADEMQKKNQPELQLLYSLWGFRYCDLLLSQGNYAEVQRRASQTLEWAKQYSGDLLSIALDNLSLGRAQLLQLQREPNLTITNHPITFLNRAVDGLRQAGHQEFIVRGLLARAEFYRVTDALDKAKRDLDEAFAIAARGGMGLHLADCHLEYVRLSLHGRGEPPVRPNEAARKHLAIAKEMINKMGYHRRDKEVQELEKQLQMTND